MSSQISMGICHDKTISSLLNLRYQPHVILNNLGFKPQAIEEKQ